MSEKHTNNFSPEFDTGRQDLILESLQQIQMEDLVNSGIADIATNWVEQKQSIDGRSAKSTKEDPDSVRNRMVTVGTTYAYPPDINMDADPKEVTAIWVIDSWVDEFGESHEEREDVPIMFMGKHGETIISDLFNDEQLQVIFDLISEKRSLVSTGGLPDLDETLTAIDHDLEQGSHTH